MTATPEKPKKNLLFSTLKIVAMFVLFLFVMFTIMANMGGSGDTLRGGLEDYISGMTGYEAHVKTLNKMSFFPVIGFDFEGLELRDPASGDDVVAIADKVRFFVGFWDVAMSAGNFRTVYIEELVASPGVILAQPVHIAKVEIVSPENAEPYLHATGHIGMTEAEARLNLRSSGHGRMRDYHLADRRNYFMRTGDAEIQASQDLAHGEFAFEDLKIKQNGVDVVTGNLRFSGNDNRSLGLTGQLVFPEFGTALTTDLVLRYANKGLDVAGIMSGPVLQPGDFTRESRLGQLVDYVLPIFGHEDGGRAAVTIPVTNMDVILTAPPFEKKIQLQDSDVHIKSGGQYAAEFSLQSRPVIEQAPSP
jgi:hypothetical protein